MRASRIYRTISANLIPPLGARGLTSMEFPRFSFVASLCFCSSIIVIVDSDCVLMFVWVFLFCFVLIRMMDLRSLYSLFLAPARRTDTSPLLVMVSSVSALYDLL